MAYLKREASLSRRDIQSLVADEERLRQLLKKLVKAVAFLLALFIVIYSVGQRHNHVADKNLPDAAVVAAEAAVRANPNDVTARLTLADAYVNGRRNDDALAQLEEVLKAVPNNRSALLGAAAILYEKGKYDPAKKYLLTFVDSAGNGEFSQSDTQLQRAYYILGLIGLKKSDSAAAVEALTRAIAIDSGDADALYSLGMAWSMESKYDDAIKAFTQALAFVPTGWCDPYTGLVKAYGATKNSDGLTYATAMSKICAGAGSSSAKSLNDLLTGPFHIQAMLGLGAAAVNDRDFASAVSWYKKVLKEEPTNLAAKGGLLSSGAGHGMTASPSASAEAP